MTKRKSNSPVFGIGTMGSGPYTRDKYPRAYSAWLAIMTGCYNEKSAQYGREGARGVAVRGAWLDFQAFAAWYEAHAYAGPRRLVLTRRLSGSDRYGPDECLLVPAELLPAIPKDAGTHRGLPGGVHRAAGRRYRALTTYRGAKTEHAPRDTPEEARADYLDARADILRSEAVRLDEILSDEIRAAVARKLAAMRAEADSLREAAAGA